MPIFPDAGSLGDRLARTLEDFALDVVRAMRHNTQRPEGLCIGAPSIDFAAGVKTRAWFVSDPENTEIELHLTWRGIAINHPDHLKLVWTINYVKEPLDEPYTFTIVDADCLNPTGLAETLVAELDLAVNHRHPIMTRGRAPIGPAL